MILAVRQHIVERTRLFSALDVLPDSWKVGAKVGYDDLDLAIAAEEHRQGRGFGVPKHCSRCDTTIENARRARLLATCKHSDTMTIRTVSDIFIDTYCTTCGVRVDTCI